ncbi:transcriptional repressor [Colwellia sp. D2M02]|uniref:Fur family transcriptional regulator n=1 Tax=Colwellia asteriadis TaxID=517723 RepID=A0ABP3WEW6_9GAMM|nr:transcriptional repressor [Colwellia sp. D2M02]MBU2893197.1 transcriptional repressor [Colwellia sp. D2M02]
MDVTQLRLTQAEDKCRQLGVQLTSKRKLVLTLLLQAGKAVSAYELIDLFKRNFQQSLPPMSVYRILEFLEQSQLIHRLHIANKYVACRHIKSTPEQTISQLLFCHQCQRVDEIELNQSHLAALDSNIKETGYQLLSSHIELNCICNSCSE